MFGMGMPEIMLILAVALIVIGPKKLPGLAKSIGRAMGEFKTATRDFKRSMDIDGDLEDVRDTLNTMKDIPTYDPDTAAYQNAEATPPADDAAGETTKTAGEGEETDQDSSAGTSATDASSTGAKPHG
jgi:Tat protein translocase TatB subunit